MLGVQNELTLLNLTLEIGLKFWEMWFVGFQLQGKPDCSRPKIQKMQIIKKYEKITNFFISIWELWFIVKV